MITRNIETPDHLIFVQTCLQHTKVIDNDDDDDDEKVCRKAGTYMLMAIEKIQSI